MAEGRVWTGRQAERGLVDHLGGLDVAVARAAELGELEALPHEVDHILICRILSSKPQVILQPR